MRPCSCKGASHGDNCPALGEPTGSVKKGSEIRGPSGPRCKRCSHLIREDGHDGFCCSDCAEASRLDLTQRQLRTLLLERDNGVCALCGIDCLELRADLTNALNHVRHDERHATPEVARKTRGEWQARLHGLVKLGWDADAIESHDSLWEADHLMPRVRGGASTLNQVRSLCIACHKAETSKLARDRAGSRRPLRRSR